MSRDVPCQVVRPLRFPARCVLIRHVTPRDREPESLAQAIIALRKKVGSQDKLAKATGVSERTVKRWEKGALPVKKYRSALIELGIDPRYFEESISPAAFRKRLEAVEREIAALRRLLLTDGHA